MALLTPVPGPTLRTERLVLRRWRDDDREPFAAMNADPEVMRFFRSTQDRATSDALVDATEASFDERGFGLWAVEVPGVAPFAGFVGLWTPSFDAHFTPAVEVGWRLAAWSWGRGYAPEGARAALAFAFDDLRLDEVISMTTEANRPSRRVMEKLGMTHDPADDFDHPWYPDWEARRHVLYRLPVARWRAGSPGTR